MLLLKPLVAALRWAIGPLYAQDDLSVANAAGATVRADINSNLQALGTNMSGSSAPGTTYAYQWWADTSNGLLKQRNGANSGWLVRQTLAETFVLARSSNTIIGVGDFGRTFNCTSTFTQTLTAAATLGDGFWFQIVNSGSGAITIDPNGAETIDGLVAMVVNPGESCIVVCNGSLFVTVGRRITLLKRKTADESVISSTTLQDDDHLTFPIGASEEWFAEFYIDCGINVTSTGAKVAVTVPSGATLNVSVNFCNTDAVGQGKADRTATSGSGVGYTPASGSNMAIIVSVWVLNSTNVGSVTLQWAQNSNVATNLTFRKGSHLIANRIA